MARSSSRELATAAAVGATAALALVYALARRVHQRPLKLLYHRRRIRELKYAVTQTESQSQTATMTAVLLGREKRGRKLPVVLPVFRPIMRFSR